MTPSGYPPPPRRQLVPAWMFAVPFDHHFGGIHDRTEHVRHPHLSISLYQRTDAPPLFDAGALRRQHGTWRGTVVRDQGTCLAGEGDRPRLRYPTVAPRKVTRADRFIEWLERRLGWQAELLP